MGARLVRRILFAAIALLAFWAAAQHYVEASSFTPETALLGGFGVLAAFLAATGKG